MAILLEIKKLNYYYGNIHILKDISLHVNEGEIVTLIGANGAGKTTTLQAISSLIPNSGKREGQIFFEGKDITHMAGHKIAGLGLSQVIEGRRIFSKLTVAENLQVGAYTRKDRNIIDDELTFIYDLFPRLKERRSQLGGTLSGGEQQMLAIGRSLISNPHMILMDEPSLGIAPILVKEIFEAIVKINREERKTIIIVEQNAKLALETANRGYVLQTGEVIMHDDCSKLEKNPMVQASYLGMV